MQNRVLHEVHATYAVFGGTEYGGCTEEYEARGMYTSHTLRTFDWPSSSSSVPCPVRGRLLSPLILSVPRLMRRVLRLLEWAGLDRTGLDCTEHFDLMWFRLTTGDWDNSLMSVGQSVNPVSSVNQYIRDGTE